MQGYQWVSILPGIILYIRLANKKRRYIVESARRMHKMIKMITYIQQFNSSTVEVAPFCVNSLRFFVHMN